jgi:hypothetical protein
VLTVTGIYGVIDNPKLVEFVVPYLKLDFVELVSSATMNSCQ